jgi:DUF1680 family protein
MKPIHPFLLHSFVSLHRVAILVAAGLSTIALDVAARAQDVASPVVKLQAEPFALEDVRITDGLFRHAQDLDRAYLLSLDPDRLLHVFRINAGLPSDAKPYGGWMTPDHLSRGEFVGHYLSACSLMYAATGDPKLKEKADQIVAGFAQCQEKFGNGFLHSHPDKFTTQGEAPLPFWYQMHKLLAGLLDANQYCGSAEALEIAKKLGDWACVGAAKLSDAQIQKMLDTEHGGINEAFANLYARTGDPKLLKLALRFNHLAVIGPAMKEEDKLEGLHANTQIPKFIGAAREFELTGDDSLRTAARFFWENVVHERSYVIGGHSDREMFSPKANLSQYLSFQTCETCNTYNMLKLTRHLFEWEPKAEYADYYERALYNHILASQHPESGMMCYYVSLNGPAKTFGDAENSFWCCYGTGIENHAKYGESIYFHERDKSLYVNLFIPSELKWKSRGMEVQQTTQFPEKSVTRLAFTCKKPVELTLCLRHPAWADAGVEVLVNDRKLDTNSQPGSYVRLPGTWKTGDTVELRMPMRIHTEGFRDNPRRLAILYGPLVLSSPIPANQPLPVIVADIDQIPASIAAETTPLHFAGSPAVFRRFAQPSDAPVPLLPFYEEYQHPHVVYWDVLTESEWKTRQAQYQARIAREKALAARVVDEVVTGIEPSESDHHLQGEKTDAAHEDTPGETRRWRHAVDGGWFAYQMKLPKDQAAELVCTYWGGDGGNRSFDILIDGTLLANETLNNAHPGEWFDQVYPIPPALTQGKDSVTVRFQSHPGAVAGGVFGCRILRKE